MCWAIVGADRLGPTTSANDSGARNDVAATCSCAINGRHPVAVVNVVAPELFVYGAFGEQAAGQAR